MNITIQSEKPCILIVDDDCIIRDLIKSFYDEYDFELIEAINGREAVEMAPCMHTRPDSDRHVYAGFERIRCSSHPEK